MGRLSILVFIIYCAIFISCGNILDDLTSTNLYPKIAFNSFRNALHDVYIMNSDGSGQTKISFYEYGSKNPVFSPTGDFLVFDGGLGLYSYHLESRQLKKLTDNLDNLEEYYSISPDGSQLLYVRGRGSKFHPESNIHILDLTNGTNINLTNDSVGYTYPAFSPDGKIILYTILRNTGIYKMNSDGSNKEQLTEDGFWDSKPKFSPEGSKIVYISSKENYRDIFLMNSDGSSPVNLTSGYAPCDNPQFSPDGSKILFEIYVKDSLTSYTHIDLAIMAVDGKNKRALTFYSGSNYGAQFTKDGNGIVFVSNRDNNDEIYMMRSNGFDQKNLTKNANYDNSPSIQPNY